jgi:hypothetical protein
MISGSVYMIRADVLRKLGWSTSITEDWELTIRLYLAGYKVLYTPYIQAPAECVSTVKRLIRQRMRWAEGHTYNVKKYFFKVLRSPNLSWREKLEFVYYAPYYLQSVVFAAGTVAWLLSDLLLGQRLPNWTALLGWSLVFTNIFALPLMNLAGVALEGSVRRDIAGIFSFIALSNLLVPFQAYAAVKGLLEREEGGWVRTPKSGRITEALGTFHLSRILPWELPGRGRRKPAFRIPRVVVGGSFVLLAVGILGLGAFSIRTAASTPGARLVDLALLPGLLGTLVPLALVALAYWKARSVLLSCGLFIAISVNLVSLGGSVPVALAAADFYYLHNVTINTTGKTMDTTVGTAATGPTKVFNAATVTQKWFSPLYPTGAGNASIPAGAYVANLRITAASGTNDMRLTVQLCTDTGATCTNIAGPTTFTATAGTSKTAYTIAANAPAQTITAAAPRRLVLFIEFAGQDGQDSFTVQYDGTAANNQDSNLSTPGVVVPDATLWLLPLALGAPIVMRRLRGKATAVPA